MQNCNHIDTPTTKGECLNLEMCPKILEKKKEMANIPYSSAIGNLMYATMCIRLDIYNAMALVSHY